jgi:hypothetical protein
MKRIQSVYSGPTVSQTDAFTLLSLPSVLLFFCFSLARYGVWSLPFMTYCEDAGLALEVGIRWNMTFCLLIVPSLDLSVSSTISVLPSTDR